MSYMFEVYYRGPMDPAKEDLIMKTVSAYEGKLTMREPSGPSSEGICLTIEFGTEKAADSAAEALRLNGHHVEGPDEY